MMEKMKKHLQSLSVVLVVACMGVIIVCGVNYVRGLRNDLRDNAVQNLMAVTLQQQQAFDNFIAEDRDHLHDFAEFFTRNSMNSPEEIRQLLTLPDEPDAIYLVMCLDEGWICGTSFDEIRQLDEENLANYRALSGSGVRDTYTGLYSGTPRFGYYETFTFGSGHKGLIQKATTAARSLTPFPSPFITARGWPML